MSLRQTVVRVDDSPASRQFVRLGVKPMMDFTTLDKFKNVVRPVTWKKIHETLARYAVGEAKITGDRLRLDTTAVETNIHWPTDSTLLWDTYRVVARLIERARTIDASVVGSGRLHLRRAKREALTITRAAAKRVTRARSLKRPYQGLIRRVEGDPDHRLLPSVSAHRSLLGRGRAPAWRPRFSGRKRVRPGG